MPSDSEEEEEAATMPPAPSSAGRSFFDTGNEEATDLTFSDVLRDERVPGESDDEESLSATESDAARRRRRRAKKNHRRIVISLVSCKYDVVAQAARGLGWRCTADDTEEYNLLWNDSYVPFDTIASLNKYQKANHFPGMSELAKKNLLAKNLNRMSKALPGEFNFVPPTFILPGEAEPLKNWAQSQVCAMPMRSSTPCEPRPSTPVESPVIHRPVFMPPPCHPLRNRSESPPSL
jgi:hypothetical protein